MRAAGFSRRPARRRATIGVALAAAILAGCPDPDPAPIDVHVLAVKVAEAWCAAQVKCGQIDATKIGDCKASVRLDYGQLVSDVDDGIVAYDAGKAGKCVDEMAKATGPTSCSLTAQLSTPPTPDCRGAIVGRLKGGSPCFVDNECEAGLCLPQACPEVACCAGSCGFLVDVAKDPSCSAAGAVCPDGFYCPDEGSARGRVCTTKLKIGDDCDAADACRANSLCLVSDGKRQCTTLPVTTPSSGPAPCAYETGCDSVTEYCNPTGLCHPLATVDASCASAPCVEGAFCLNQTCVARRSAGGPCDADEQCLGTLSCIGGTCQQEAPARVCSL